MRTLLEPTLAVATVGAMAVGAGAAWWLHRRTSLSHRNLYLAALGPVVAVSVAVFGEAWGWLPLLAPALAGVAAAVALARRTHVAAKGAGGELREFELARTMLWTALGRAARRERRTRRSSGERTWIGGQGQVVRRRGWPAGEPFVPMAANGAGRIPRRAGQHLLIVGATGAGKTVSARRWLTARVLADRTAAIATDPKGDQGLEDDLRAAAQLAGRPFVLFDPRNPSTDRWNPLWSNELGAVVSRLVAPIASSEGNARYYADLLQIHLGIVAAGLRAAGLWPANLPLLLAAAQLANYEQLGDLVRAAPGQEQDLRRRMQEHHDLITTTEGRRDLTGGTLRLRVVAGETWQTVLTPDARGAVTLPAALEAGAVVLVRTWVDDLPEEAKAITTLFLADVAAAALAVPAGTAWAALIDEFGGVLSSGAGERALALMQRARSGGGQVAVTTQSIADFAAATENPALLEAMADNFAGGIFHRQSSPDSRDWLSRMIGTRELWQNTDRTLGGRGDSTGSRRRVNEFVVRPDRFRDLRTGEAVIWTTLGPDPEQVNIAPARLPHATDPPAATDEIYRPCGPTELPASRRDQIAAPKPGADDDTPEHLPLQTVAGQ
jgi:hypothetical protein